MDAESVEISGSEPLPPKANLASTETVSPPTPPAPPPVETSEFVSKGITSVTTNSVPETIQNHDESSKKSVEKCADVSDLEEDIGLLCVERYEKEMKAWKSLEETYKNALQKTMKSDKFCPDCGDSSEWKNFLPDKDREKVEGNLDYEAILKKADRSFKKTVCLFNDISFQFRRKQVVMRKIEANVQREARALRFKFLGDVTVKPM